MVRSRNTRECVCDSGTWEQADTPARGFREIETFSGYPFPLPYDSIEALKARGFASEEIYSIVAPRRTLARRKEMNENLSVAESDRVIRLNRISDMAERVFGNHEKAQRWLRKRSRVLNEAPIVLLQSETGAHLVEEELNSIDYGMFA
jgi:putative toxin-antitoxin system antitoxin component (TIGR02293 family)